MGCHCSVNYKIDACIIAFIINSVLENSWNFVLPESGHAGGTCVLLQGIDM